MKSKIKYEFGQINIGVATVMAAVFIFVDFGVWCAVGSPVYVLRFVSGSVPVLPLWIFGLFDFISFALLGFALGAVLGNRCAVSEVAKYRGAFYFIIGVTLVCLHHAFFFSHFALFVALLTSVLMCFFLVVAVVNFARVSGLAVFAAAVGLLWSIYILVLNFISFFFM